MTNEAGMMWYLRARTFVPRELCSRSEGGDPNLALPVRGGPASALERGPRKEPVPGT